jgi:hypothetical protein
LRDNFIGVLEEGNKLKPNPSLEIVLEILYFSGAIS